MLRSFRNKLCCNRLTELAELEREVALSYAAPLKLQLYLDGNMGVAYVNDVAAMNFRAYDLAAGNWGFFVTDGAASFRDIKLTLL